MRHHSWKSTIWIALFGLLSLAPTLLVGQVESGQITGVIKDPSGALVSGAKVSATSATTGLRRDTVANNVGTYSILGLRPDTYTVLIEAKGFQKWSRKIEVFVGGVADGSAELSVGGEATTLEVTAAPVEANVNTDNAMMSANVTSQQLAELPTLTRNPYDLVATAGNVGEDNNSMRGAGYTINGQRSASTNILLDGGENVDTFTADVGQTVPLDSVQEFSVLTNQFGAEYGRASGGIVNVITKSGTNTFHGGAYEYNRVATLSSNTYYNDANQIPKAGFTRNQFGFSLGGPVIKNKLFFFDNLEWIRVRSNGPQTYDILDPASVATTAPATQAFFAAYGKLAPGTTIGPQFPCGTLTCDQVTFLAAQDFGGGAPQNTWENVARIDFNISDRTTLSGRYAAYKELDFPGYINASPYAGYNTGQTNFDQNYLVSLSHVFTPSLINTAKIVYNRLNGPVQGLGTAPVGPTLYSAGNLPTVPGNGLPLVFPGYSETTPGNAIPFGGPQNLYQFYDDVSWTKSKHTLKFGGQFIQIRDNRTFGAYENAVEIAGPTLDTGIANLITGNIYQFQGAVYPQGKFPCLLNASGVPQVSPACTLQLPVSEPAFNRNYHYNDGAAYVADSWKVKPRFTVNLGVRWEYFGVQHNANPALDSNFVLGSGATIFDQVRNGQVKLAGQGGVFWKPSYNNWGPRIGFAWDVFGNGSTSLRGGYGISYERNFGNVTFNAIQNPPNYAVVSLTAGPGKDVPSLPVYTDNAGPLAGTGSKALPLVSQRAINQNLHTAYAQTWDLSVQHQMAKASVLSVDYAGSHGVHLYDISNINLAGFGGAFLGDARASNRLNYGYSNMNYRSSNGYNHYNALNVRWTTTNLARTGLNLTANYTWSHATDNLSSTFTETNGGNSGLYYLGYLDAFNPKLDYGNSDYDIRNRLAVSGTWDVPWMKNASNGFERYALGGWGIGSIFKVRSGNPYSIFDSSNFNGTDYPLWVAPGGVPQSGSATTQVAPNVFNYLALPNTAGTVNNLGVSLGIPSCTGLDHVGCTYTTNGQAYPRRNSYVSPGYWNLDMNFYKNFKLTERFNLQFRGEFYNIFNHHNMFIQGLNLDAASLSTSGAGAAYIQSAKGEVDGYPTSVDERRNIQFALRLSF